MNYIYITKTAILFIIISFIFLFTENKVISNTLHVPADFTTIEAALNAASTNDTVLVQPGTYNESITWPPVHGIKLISAGDTTNTIISGDGSACVIRFPTNNWYDTTTQVTGFKITNGNGGIAMTFASPKLTYLNITANVRSSTWAFGGGIDCSASSSPIIENVSITYNVVKDGTWHEGAGMYCDLNSDPTLTNVVISYNSMGPGAIYYYGGGFACSINCDPTFNNVEIKSNYSADGGIYYYGGGAYFGNSSSAVLNRVSITSNVMGNGGSVYKGGGLYCPDSSLVITNGLIASNIMGIGATYYYGGGLSSSICTLMNVTIANNIRADGLEIIGSGVNAGYGSTVVNTISWNDNPGDEITGNNIDISFSDIRGGWTGTGNLDTDPLFISDDDFHLQENSPCIDTGTFSQAPACDLEGKPRPIGPGIDLGAYEMGDAVSFTADQTGVCEGDVVHFTDLSAGIPGAWAWTFEGGTPATSTDQHPSITYDSAGIFDVQLEVFYGSSSSVQLQVDYIHVDTTPSQPGIPVGPIQVCSNDTIEYYSSGSNNSDTLLWLLSPVDAGEILSYGNNIMVLWSNTYVGLALLSCQGRNDSCIGPSSDSLEIFVNAIPDPEVSGLALVCINDVTDYETSATPGSSYSWEVSGGVIIFGAGSHQITVEWGEDQGTGNIYVRETNEAGCVEQSEDFVVNIDECTGINEYGEAFYIIRPNPTRGLIFISKVESSCHIYLYNHMGEMIMSKLIASETDVQLDLSAFEPGIYLLRIQGKTTVGVYRIVKI